MDEVTGIAEKIANNSPLAISYAKEMINKGQDMELTKALELELQEGV
ncbi:MAG: crotonase, partial [Candidatus Dadabacteria bacterium]|nr:crotonase [Candidatus Dadabacteria bacterium]